FPTGECGRNGVPWKAKTNTKSKDLLPQRTQRTRKRSGHLAIGTSHPSPPAHPFRKERVTDGARKSGAVREPRTSHPSPRKSGAVRGPRTSHPSPRKSGAVRGPRTSGHLKTKIHGR